jgi:hypothetical protein
VKKVFVRSGIRYDVVLADKNTSFLQELCEHHVSGQLKVAPEHVSDAVLKRMGKPGKKVYEQFVNTFKDINEDLGKKQYLVPYLMSSHPGSGLKEAIELAEYVRDMGVNPEQVQDFIPTPGTLSTCMYYTGLDPKTLEKVYVPRTMEEKAMQRALIQYRNPKNFDLVEKALKLAHREDLIGFGPKCLIRPRNIKRQELNTSSTGKKLGKKKVNQSATPDKKMGRKSSASTDANANGKLVSSIKSQPGKKSRTTVKPHHNESPRTTDKTRAGSKRNSSKK